MGIQTRETNETGETEYSSTTKVDQREREREGAMESTGRGRDESHGLWLRIA